MATTTIDAGLTVPADGNDEAPVRVPVAPGAGSTESLATGLGLVVCLVARLPHRILDATGIRSWGLALVVVVSVVCGARVVARAPLAIARSRRTNAGRGAALRAWAGEELKTLAVSVLAGTVVTLPLYALLRSTPAWWLPAFLMFAVLTLVWQVAMPLVMRARADRRTPTPPALAARVQAVAAQAGVDVEGVIVTGTAASGRGNAYVVGLGRTRRVVLEQDLAAWPPELVDQVVAHELGHWRLGHGARRLPLTLLAELAAVAAAAGALSYRPLLDLAGIAAAGDPRSYPLLLVVGAVVALPVRCLLAWRDRAQERAADRFALDLLGRPDHFEAMLHCAADRSGAPRSLPWWRRPTASHPPIDERIVACHQAPPAVGPTGRPGRPTTGA